MAWYDEAVFYHIYPLGMLNAPLNNDYSKPVSRLKELNKWISHIKDIGCNAIYIGPLFESVGHGYETTDYKKLDSRLGTNKDLKNFVNLCHDSGLHVIFDGVFYHTGRDFFAFKDLLENRENSRYKDWYCNVNFYSNNEYNDGFTYDNWGGYNLLVKLNQRNPEVTEYIFDVIRYWVNEFDVDGIRLDAADVLDFDFMKGLRKLADGIKDEFWLMGEVIHGDYSRWVNDNTLHSVTDYALHKAFFSGHNDHNYFEIAHTIRRINDLLGPKGADFRLYNFTDNHDVERIISKLNNKSDYYPVHILEYTLPGIPSIYYGSEFAIEGKKEKFSDASLRPALDFSDYKNAITDNPYTAFIALLGYAKRISRALSYGDYQELLLTNRQYAFSRNTDEESCIVLVNNDDNSADISVYNLRDGVYVGLIGNKEYTVTNGSVSINIAPHYGEILVQASLINKEVVIRPIKKAPSIQEPQENASVTEYNDVESNQKNVIEEHNSKNHEINGDSIIGCDSENKSDSKIGKEIVDECEDFKNEKRGAALKYNLDEKYSKIEPSNVNCRNDYDAMSIEELQVAILEKMSANGPINEQMIRTVMENVYHDSLINWVRSFR